MEKKQELVEQSLFGPHKAPQGPSAPPSGSPAGANNGRKRHNTGSIARAAGLGKTIQQIVGQDPKPSPSAMNSSFPQCGPMTWRSKAAQIPSGQTVQVHKLVREASFQSSLSHLALARDMAEIPQKGTKSGQPEEWYQQPPLHFHRYAEPRAKLKAEQVRKSSSWTSIPRKEAREAKEATQEV